HQRCVVQDEAVSLGPRCGPLVVRPQPTYFDNGLIHGLPLLPYAGPPPAFNPTTTVSLPTSVSGEYLYGCYVGTPCPEMRSHAAEQAERFMAGARRHLTGPTTRTNRRA